MQSETKSQGQEMFGRGRDEKSGTPSKGNSNSWGLSEYRSRLTGSHRKTHLTEKILEKRYHSLVDENTDPHQIEDKLTQEIPREDIPILKELMEEFVKLDSNRADLKKAGSYLATLSAFVSQNFAVERDKKICISRVYELAKTTRLLDELPSFLDDVLVSSKRSLMHAGAVWGAENPD